jgi:S-formylglutathione hydrolase FrmB
MALLLAAAAVSFAGCKGNNSAPPAPTPAQRGQACSATLTCSTGLVCTDTPAGQPATPGAPTCNAPARHYTFKAISGVSMGGIGSSRIVAQRPDLFDSVGTLGGPLDAALILHNIETEQMGGFCSSAQLEAALALDKADHGNRLDTPGAIAGCAETNAAVVTKYGRSQRFNHWAYTVNGGHFDRNFYLDVFTDLTEAFGNPLSHNAASPALAAPMTPAQYANASCANPFVLHHVRDAAYSPSGEHDAISFCDGEPPLKMCADDTQVDWCAAAKLNGRQLAQYGDEQAFCATHGGNAHDVNQSSSDPKEVDLYFNQHGAMAGCWPSTRLVPFALAIDLNGNGRRDYNEPLLSQGHEPFQDVGTDGCADNLEDGKGGCTTAALSPFSTGMKDPNGDNYDPTKNPAGTEGNWIYDPGEPFQDVGLDGVEGTADEGEGDGKFSTTVGYQHWFAQDLRTQLATMSDERKAALGFYLEGGIRDVFDLGAQAEATASAVLRYSPSGLNRFNDFPDIPAMNGLAWNSTAPSVDLETAFDPLRLDPAAMVKNSLVLYGNPNASPASIRDGNGDHVGSISEAYDRFVVFFQWVSAQWDPVLGPPMKEHGTDGEERDLVLHSTQLKADWAFSIVTPPGYNDAANVARRYPVVLVLHGYGMDAHGMAGTGAVPNVLASDGLVHPMITLFPSGKCCLNGPNGEKTCRETDDSGNRYEDMGYVRECETGDFFVDRQGITGSAADQSKYAQALFELMSYVDAHYRTMTPADGQAF